MAKHKIIWSHRARTKLYSILDFYAQRNKNKSYSDRLFKRFHEEISRLADYPNLGVKTEIENVRALVVEQYRVYYEQREALIIIHAVWDSRQDPDKLEVP